MGIIVNDIAVMSGRTAGVAIIILGLALGWKSADGVGGTSLDPTLYGCLLIPLCSRGPWGS